MLQITFGIFIGLSLLIQHVRLREPVVSQFEFNEEARNALCPFVGNEGLQCFDGEPIKYSIKQSDDNILQLPRGVGVTIDRSTGQLKAFAVQLTYSFETGRVWTDRFTGEIFGIFNEVVLGSPNRFVAAHNVSRIQIFRNASQLNAVWQQTFISGKIRGGQLANPPNLYKYIKSFSARGNALILSQSIIGLYTLTINPSTIQLNSFARNALSKLTPQFDLELYGDFVEKWGTHIITRSLIGGMIEEQAKVIQCFPGDEHSRYVQCLPFEDRHLSDSDCSYYQDRNRIISKRRLGGNVRIDKNHEWKQTLSFAPAMLQILEMVPWYDFVTDESIKKNLRSIIGYRQKTMDSIQAATIHSANMPLTSCEPVIPNLPVNARWQQNGITVAGGHGNGSNNNQLARPYGLFVVQNEGKTLLIVDHSNHRIMQLQWKIAGIRRQLVAGGNGQGSGLDQMNYPTDVLIDKETNSLVIADCGNQRVVRWSRHSGTAKDEILIDNISCWGLAMDEQRNLYVSDYKKHEVRRYEIDRGDKKGTVVAGGNGQGNGLNQLDSPLYLFVDRNQSLYVSEHGNHRVTKWDKGATQSIVVAGGQGNGAALTQLSCPHAIFVDTLGTLYVADTWNHRVTRWPQGSKLGTIVVGGNGAGIAANQFHATTGLTFDAHGNLYVSDWGNHRVQRFNLIQ